MTPKPWINSDAGIARELRNDSEALRYAEWWTRTRIYGLSDEALRELRNQYIQAYREIMATASEYVGVPRARLVTQLAQIEREIDAITDRLMQTQSAQLDATLTDAWRQGYYGRAWLLDNVTVAEFSAVKNVLVPTEAIRAALLSPYIGTDGWINVRREVLERSVKNSIIQGLLQGEGIQQIRARLARELGIKPGQTSNFKAAYYRALLIARTETLRASNLGALAIYEQNQDVLSGWEWTATNDERTCRICGRLDGQTFAFGSTQAQPPSGSHPGCRCTIVPVLRNPEILDPELRTPRLLYPDWAQQNGIVLDGGLATQRGSDAHGLNRTAA